MGFSVVSYEKQDFLAWLRLNRPEARNALNFQLVAEIVQALENARADSGVRVVIITGTGDSFCAGMDIKSAAAWTRRQAAEYNELWYTKLTVTLHLLGKPVIAAVNGPCVGGGCGLAERCDVIIASEKARFGFPEINVGGNPAVHFTILPQLIGRHRAFELLFSGELFSAHEAERLGLVNRVVAHDRLEEEARELARKFAAKSPAIVKSLRDCFYHVPGVDYKAALSNTGESLGALLYMMEDVREGLRAFSEKRPPVWKEE